jgi:hypothetical protein
MEEKYINTISGESQTLENWIYETKLEGYHQWDQQEEEITPEQYVEDLIRSGGLVREEMK